MDRGSLSAFTARCRCRRGNFRCKAGERSEGRGAISTRVGRGCARAQTSAGGGGRSRWGRQGKHPGREPIPYVLAAGVCDSTRLSPLIRCLSSARLRSPSVLERIGSGAASPHLVLSSAPRSRWLRPSTAAAPQGVGSPKPICCIETRITTSATFHRQSRDQLVQSLFRPAPRRGGDEEKQASRPFRRTFFCDIRCL